MPFCPTCGTNLNDDFRFCPHCGRPVSTTGLQIVQRSDDPRLYEEAILRLRFTIEYQVLYSGKGMFGNYTQRSYVQIGYIDLMAMSHTKGEYVAMTSEQFRGLLRTGDLGPFTYVEKEWTRIYNIVEQGMQLPSSTHPQDAFFASIIQERKTSWNNFCTLLSEKGWFGIADDAVRRKNPLENPISLEQCYGASYNLSLYDWDKTYKKKEPNHVFTVPCDSRNYRYRRQV